MRFGDARADRDPRRCDGRPPRRRGASARTDALLDGVDSGAPSRHGHGRRRRGRRRQDDPARRRRPACSTPRPATVLLRRRRRPRPGPRHGARERRGRLAEPVPLRRVASATTWRSPGTRASAALRRGRAVARAGRPRRPTRSSAACRTGWTPSSANAARRCPAASGSGSAWPARCCAQPRLLVLDDATSALDPRVERQVLAASGRSWSPTAGRPCSWSPTGRAVSRSPTGWCCVDDGRVAAVGRHADLLATPRGYRRIVTAYDAVAGGAMTRRRRPMRPGSTDGARRLSPSLRLAVGSRAPDRTAVRTSPVLVDGTGS